jgi:hypothetical protein
MSIDEMEEEILENATIVVDVIHAFRALAAVCACLPQKHQLHACNVAYDSDKAPDKTELMVPL